MGWVECEPSCWTRAWAVPLLALWLASIWQGASLAGCRREHLCCGTVPAKACCCAYAARRHSTQSTGVIRGASASRSGLARSLLQLRLVQWLGRTSCEVHRAPCTCMNRAGQVAGKASEPVGWMFAARSLIYVECRPRCAELRQHEGVQYCSLCQHCIPSCASRQRCTVSTVACKPCGVFLPAVPGRASVKVRAELPGMPWPVKVHMQVVFQLRAATAGLPVDAAFRYRHSITMRRA